MRNKTLIFTILKWSPGVSLSHVGLMKRLLLKTFDFCLLILTTSCSFAIFLPLIVCLLLLPSASEMRIPPILIQQLVKEIRNMERLIWSLLPLFVRLVTIFVVASCRFVPLSKCPLVRQWPGATVWYNNTSSWINVPNMKRLSLLHIWPT